MPEGQGHEAEGRALHHLILQALEHAEGEVQVRDSLMHAQFSLLPHAPETAAEAHELLAWSSLRKSSGQNH